MAPPEANRDVANWKDNPSSDSDSSAASTNASDSADDSVVSSNPELDDLRRRLEGLL